MACSGQLTAGLDPTCATQDQMGGIDKRIYVGETNDIDTATTVFATDGSLTTLDLLTGKTLKRFIGRAEKHTPSTAGEAGDNRNFFMQSVAVWVQAKTQAEKNAAEDLFKSRGIFIGVETNGDSQSEGQIEFFGLPKNLTGLGNFELKGSAYQHDWGTALNDPNQIVVTLSGRFPNDAIVYNPTGNLATNIAALDAMSL